jgi:alanine-glyoxylate transaminase/(R)-3-amino-2-methylpropionate-pyruvate transaminase
MACAAGRAVLRVIEDDKLMKNVQETGALFEEKMMILKERFDLIGDVRGKGLMRGVEFVKDRTTKEPAPDEATRVAEMNKDNGLILGRGGVFGNILRFNPPMCVTMSDIQFAAEVMSDSCSKL